MMNSNLPIKPAGALRICTISDVHLGHRKTPTYAIITELEHLVVNRVAMSQLDALFITGDLFDRLLNLPFTDVGVIHQFFIKLLTLAKQFNVKVRVLEGTPSHDWKQSRLLVHINENNQINADLHYVTELSIVEDTSLNLTIGYIPDEWSTGPEAATKEFLELMKTYGHRRIDMLLMHGMFSFQVPPNVKIPSYDPEVFTDLVRYMIFIGHDHKFKTFENIIVPGSSSRLAHNEEGKKGIIITDILNGVVQNHFVENTLATSYITLNLTEQSDEDCIELIEQAIGSLSAKHAFLKLKLNSATTLRKFVKERQKTTSVMIELEFLSNEISTLIEGADFSLKEVTVNITPDNVYNLLLTEMNNPEIDTDIYSSEMKTIMERCA